MLLRAGGVKVLDFGIAQATNFARQVETGGGRVKGKLAYLSPEQVRLQELDGRSDLFALGVVLWETLVGQRLFPGENDFLTMRNVLSQPVPAPSSIRPEVPPALDAIVARALERDRELRYPSAQAMADDLERFLQEAPCHSQAVPRLLHELFGEDATDQTPELPLPSLPPELPSDALAEIDARAAASSSAGDARPAADNDDGGFIVEIDAVPDDMGAAASASPAPAPERSRSGRRVVVALATATLAGCLLWAGQVWRGKHAAPLDAVTAPVPAVTTQAAAAAPEPAVPPAKAAPAKAAPQPAAPATAVAEPAAEADADDDAEPAGDAKASGRGKGGRKHASRRISNDVTLDPFK
jgi:serine/threonine-protein kinase